MIEDPILPIDTRSGERMTTLPGVLASLARDEVEGFPGLRAHQRHGWFLFLAQLGALALHAGARDRPPEEEASWRSLLLRLTGGAREPWMLVVDDLAKPAFLQPPRPAKGLSGYRPLTAEPDALDVLVTAKAHDLKPAQVTRAEPHHWVYALITLQTMEGFLGRGNYGIARMNGGFASRPLVELTESERWGRRLQRAWRLCLERREAILDRNPMFRAEAGLGLLWLEPWEEDESLGLERLDPFFIEICRRIRLVHGASGGITSLYRNSDAPRVLAKDYNGRVGDPWIPINAKEGKALTVGGNGFDYRLITKLFEESEFDKPEAMLPFADDPTDRLLLHMAVLVRGQGETDGLHERWLRVPGRAVRLLLRRGGDTTAGQVGKEMITDAGNALSALRGALAVFVQGGPDKAKQESRTRDGVGLLDRRIDQELFFDHFWNVVAAEDAAAHQAAARAWKAALGDLLQATFEESIQALAAPATRVERARARAELMLWGLRRKHGLKRLAEDTEEEAAA